MNRTQSWALFTFSLPTTPRNSAAIETMDWLISQADMKRITYSKKGFELALAISRNICIVGYAVCGCERQSANWGRLLSSVDGFVFQINANKFSSDDFSAVSQFGNKHIRAIIWS